MHAIESITIYHVQKSKKKLQSRAELTAGDLVVKQMGRSFPSEPERLVPYRLQSRCFDSSLLCNYYSNSPDLTISDDMWTDQEEDLEETVVCM